MNQFILKKEDKTIIIKDDCQYYYSPQNDGNVDIEFDLLENANLSLYILALGKNIDKNIINIKINHQGKFSKSFINSKIIGDDQSFQKIKINVDMVGENSFSNNIQKQILLSKKARAICEPIIVTKGESIVANHGASSGLNITEELFYMGLRGLDDEKSLSILIYNEVFFINWPETLKNKIEKQISDLNYKNMLEIFR